MKTLGVCLLCTAACAGRSPSLEDGGSSGEPDDGGTLADHDGGMPADAGPRCVEDAGFHDDEGAPCATSTVCCGNGIELFPSTCAGGLVCVPDPRSPYNGMCMHACSADTECSADRSCQLVRDSSLFGAVTGTRSSACLPTMTCPDAPCRARYDPDACAPDQLCRMTFVERVGFASDGTIDEGQLRCKQRCDLGVAASRCAQGGSCLVDDDWRVANDDGIGVCGAPVGLATSAQVLDGGVAVCAPDEGRYCADRVRTDRAPSVYCLNAPALSASVCAMACTPDAGTCPAGATCTANLGALLGIELGGEYGTPCDVEACVGGCPECADPGHVCVPPGGCVDALTLCDVGALDLRDAG